MPPGALSGVPQSAQNFAPGALSELQFEQRADNRLPHSAQNFLPGIPSVPHLEQSIFAASGIHPANSSRRALASLRSAVSKPSVNQL
jgi:hypothetical protein